MLLRSFMVILLTAGVLVTVSPKDEKPIKQLKSETHMIEEYTFEPVYIYVPAHTQDAGLD